MTHLLFNLSHVRSQLQARARSLSRVALLGACVFALGCELETGTDASVNEAGVVAAEDGSTSSDAGSSSTLDATQPPSNDAATAPANDATTTPNSDAELPPRSDASILDGATSDAAASDGAMSDATVSDAAASDGAASDGGTPDTGSAADAHVALDAANVDAGTGTDASSADAAPSGRSGSGEVRWNVFQGEGTEGTAFCPQQSIALWRDETITLRDVASPGFRCTDYSGTCQAPSDLDSEAEYLFANQDFGLFLMFRARVVLGYSLESFRANLVRAQLNWKTTSKTSIEISPGHPTALELSTFEPPTVEIVSYQAPVLHVRIQARSVWMTNTFREPATAPYLCVADPPGPIGPFPSLCDTVDCRYSTEDNPANATHLTLDLELPIQQPTP